MNKIVLDIDRLDREGHDYLKEAFGFPDYYGKNLDALYDCLSDLRNTEIIIYNIEDVDEFSLKVLRVIDDVAEETDELTITYAYDGELIDD